jgi:putative PIN family toxin of toxin-antitoxin system
VFVRALINPHGPSGQIIFLHSNEFQLYFSAPTRAELLEVLQRSAITRKIKATGLVARPQLLMLVDQAPSVSLAQVPPVSRDPKDDLFLATARAAQADYLVSEDQDLLVLGSHGGTRIVDTATFLRALAQQASGEETPT